MQLEPTFSARNLILEVVEELVRVDLSTRALEDRVLLRIGEGTLKSERLVSMFSSSFFTSSFSQAIDCTRRSGGRNKVMAATAQASSFPYVIRHLGDQDLCRDNLRTISR